MAALLGCHALANASVWCVSGAGASPYGSWSVGAVAPATMHVGEVSVVQGYQRPWPGVCAFVMAVTPAASESLKVVGRTAIITSSASVEWSVTTVSGTVAVRGVAGPGVTSVSLDGLPSGVYLMSAGSVTSKLIVH